jgi:signal peptidase I
MKKRLPIVAAICSLVEPGLGFVYNGALRQGVTISLACLIAQFGLMFSGIYKSYYSTIAAYVLILAVSRLALAALSARRAKTIGLLQLHPFNRWYVYLGFALLPLVPRETVPLIRELMPQRVFVCRSVSMQPTIEPDEWIVADMRHFSKHELRPGDVVVYYSPNEQKVPYLKRCVAVAGQKVQIRDGVLFVNDQQFAPLLPLVRTTDSVLARDFNDPRIRPAGAGNEDQYGPVIVPDSCSFLLGDHRDNSLDSRYFGFFKKSEILGKALYIFYSDNFDRIGKTIF